MKPGNVLFEMEGGLQRAQCLLQALRRLTEGCGDLDAESKCCVYVIACEADGRALGQGGPAAARADADIPA